MYGDGPLRSSLERLSSSLGANIEFRGHSPNLREQLSSVDILLQPRSSGETFGIVNAEASNAGCVVLAYMRSGATSPAAFIRICWIRSTRPYADVVMPVLTDQRAVPTFDERFARLNSRRGDRFLSSLITETDDAEDVVSAQMAVLFSPASKYASSLISER